MKIAVCISGELRLFNNPLVIKNYIKFIEKHNPDLYISTWDHIGVSMNHGYIDPSLEKEIQNNIEKSILEVYKNIKYLKIENYNNWYNSLDSDIKNIAFSNDYFPRTINSYTQLYKIYDSILLKHQYEIHNGIKYDIVIRMRPDNLFISDLELSNLLDNTIYHINIGEAHYPNRVYDMFFYGDSNSMDNIAATYLNFETLIKHEFNNGLCPRDPCRLLYLQSKINEFEIISTKKRCCDIYRGDSFEDYYSLLKSWGGVE
jgi:hypothetical protein